ncbi:hypothetical protein SMACR_00167 [Sordaria macrospora]|uniref:WGS project CABT00000000 data, contig 2.1 n=2 Tax=Sordaria macrospora TaxID=5147 RepID=F7VKC5_SORMK|nr:uncharacterized protein SMAC_00167 [Sordaria macrospora k-hell]KAA8628389.1 hypothetical protein SMACR_00167 [Sordaria macrospora]KAH7632282.1 hypothetical protein B0T09DRAFT_261742 [Sordaria sp. MPI-SDFR-AT-0083]WPJ63552.1 hypothetical protein SMAC4_00167 [Sordaria macrospora]CCC05952.1 unnamed protein product [Sordaria macrospora k-hell]
MILPYAMALPKLGSLQECSDFSKTVTPFLPQLYALPRQILGTVFNGGSFLKLYMETNPFISGLGASIFLGGVFLVAAEVNKNYSQVDRFWSILPTVYIGHFATWARLVGIPSRRIDAALLFSTIWSTRLTYNYWRKGGYGIGHEDYRWQIVRDMLPKWAFHILNWTFISFIQSVLLYMFASPVYVLLLATQFEPELSTADIGFTVMELGLILTEFIADHQQWVFQSAKKEYQTTGQVPAGHNKADLDRGFITSGLWAYSRHPNFAAEQSIWLTLYQWGCFATNSLYNWTVLSPIMLMNVFQGSTWLTERITSGKYPEYSAYQKKVGTFIPKTLKGYTTPVPKVIRTSDLAKKLQEKEKEESKKQK